MKIPARFLLILAAAWGRVLVASVPRRVRVRRLPRLLLRTLTAGPVLLGAGGVALGALIVFWLYKDTPVGLGMLMFSPIWVPVFTFVLVAGREALGVGGGLAADVQATLLARSRCPGCRFDLSGAEEDPADGCVVCPECGAAWRARRLVAGGAEPEVEVIRGWAPAHPAEC